MKTKHKNETAQHPDWASEETKERMQVLIRLAKVVYEKLGWGFKEEVYQDALEVELKLADVPYVREKHLYVHYEASDGNLVELQHTFRADFFCFDQIIVETKSVYLGDNGMESVDRQIANYMSTTRTDYALLLNFRGKNLFWRVYPGSMFGGLKQMIDDEDSKELTNVIID